jgi:hypothetical protein
VDLAIGRSQLNDNRSRFRRDCNDAPASVLAAAAASHGNSVSKGGRQQQLEQGDRSRVLPSDADQNFVEEDWDDEDDE